MGKPTKEQLIADLKNSFQKTTDWINTQAEDNFNATLVPGKWTIAGHLYHLIKSTKSVSKGMLMPKMGLQTMFGRNTRAERSYQGMVEKYEGALRSTNIKAPSNFEAAAGRTFDRPTLIKRFEDELQDFVQAMDHWTEEEMSVYVMPHPAIGKCTIREFVYFTILHTYHHLEILQEQYVKVA